jgi:hypothetical protein
MGSGTAFIRVVDESGHELVSESEAVTYDGEHYFYFSAKDLPAGTYFYTIEFPQGVIIAKKSMLVVK